VLLRSVVEPEPAPTGFFAGAGAGGPALAKVRLLNYYPTHEKNYDITENYINLQLQRDGEIIWPTIVIKFSFKQVRFPNKL